MNDGLSFISSNVHITTTECVSGSFMYPRRDTAKILIVQKIERKNVCVVCTLLLLLLLLSPTFLSFLSCLTFSTLSFVFLLFFLVAKPQRLVAVSHPTKTLWTSVCWAQKKVKEAAWWPWSSRFNILVLWVKHLWQMHSWYCYLEVVHVWNGAAFQSMKTS